TCSRRSTGAVTTAPSRSARSSTTPWSTPSATTTSSTSTTTRTTNDRPEGGAQDPHRQPWPRPLVPPRRREGPRRHDPAEQGTPEAGAHRLVRSRRRRDRRPAARPLGGHGRGRRDRVAQAGAPLRP